MRVLSIFLIVALCSVSVLCGQTCSSNPFGVASGFNLFVLQNIDGCSSDVEGKVAGGTNVHLRNYLIGDRLPYTEEYALISGGPISFHNGGVVHGGILGQSVSDIDNVHISVSGTVVDAEVCCPDSTCGYCTAGSSPIDFAAARTELRGLSDLWGSWDTTNGAIYTDEFGNINLHCAPSTTLNVFTGISVTADNNEININCAAGQTVLINYTPATAGFPSSFGVNLRGGVTAATVIHHFVNPAITLTSASGAVFAPYSSLAFPHGLITGDVVVDNFDTPSSCNGGQINYAPFTGCIPVDSDDFYCCLYERNEFTRTYCTDLPCSYVSFPQWSFVGEYEVDSCRNCCFTDE